MKHNRCYRRVGLAMPVSSYWYGIEYVLYLQTVPTRDSQRYLNSAKESRAGHMLICVHSDQVAIVPSSESITWLSVKSVEPKTDLF